MDKLYPMERTLIVLPLEQFLTPFQLAVTRILDLDPMSGGPIRTIVNESPSV